MGDEKEVEADPGRGEDDGSGRDHGPFSLGLLARYPWPSDTVGAVEVVLSYAAEGLAATGQR
jgi:hypothetical protein